jgi:hypothetical protein
MIKDLLRRYKEGVHPCMLLFLIGLYYDSSLQAFYDGDHIVTWNDKPVPTSKTGRWDSLKAWSYKELIDSFIELNQAEKDLLKTYYYGEFRNNK